MRRGVRVLLSSLVAGLTAVSAASRASGQVAPLVLDVAGGASIPVGSLRSGTGTGEGTRAGPSFDLDFAVTSGGRRTLFLGFSQVRFGCAPAGCPAGGSYVATGMNAGVRLNIITSGPVLPWAGVGAVTSRVEMPGVTGAPAGVSGVGFGGRAGFGVIIGASHLVALNPSLRFTAVDVGLPGGRGTLRMRYLVADLGVVLSF